MKENWKVITNLIYCGLNNINGTHWNLQFSRYTDETRTSIKGGSIGYMDRDGIIRVSDPSKHKVIITNLRNKPDYIDENVGCLVWLEKE